MQETKIWVTQKLITAYNDCEGDWDDPKTWSFNNDLSTSRKAAIPCGYEVESLYINEPNNCILIRALLRNEYWFTWVDASILKKAPIRYLVRQSTINLSKWEIYNSIWNQKTVGEYNNQRIAAQHAAALNSNFKVGRIGAAWFSIQDGSWMVELMPVECLKLIRTRPDAGYTPFSSEEKKALNNGICLTFHPHRNPYEVRIVLFKIMRERYGIKPAAPSN